MKTNNVYNLMNQLAEESKSVWRIKKYYKKDAQGSKALQYAWSEIAKTKEMLMLHLEGLLQIEMKDKNRQ